MKAIIANKFAPGLLDRYLAHAGYAGQLTDETQPADAPANLFATVDGAFGAHGRFDDAASGLYKAMKWRHRRRGAHADRAVRGARRFGGRLV